MKSLSLITGFLFVSNILVLASCESKFETERRESKAQCYQRAQDKGEAYLQGCLWGADKIYECEKKYSDDVEVKQCVMNYMNNLANNPNAVLSK